MILSRRCRHCAIRNSVSRECPVEQGNSSGTQDAPAQVYGFDPTRGRSANNFMIARVDGEKLDAGPKGSRIEIITTIRPTQASSATASRRGQRDGAQRSRFGVGVGRRAPHDPGPVGETSRLTRQPATRQDDGLVSDHQYRSPVAQRRLVVSHPTRPSLKGNQRGQKRDCFHLRTDGRGVEACRA
jgi:hypothetical protein